MENRAGGTPGGGGGAPVGPGGGGHADLVAALISRARRRVLLVGESPARGTLAALDDVSRAGRRLRVLLGTPDFDTVNLVGRAGPAWPLSLVRVRARQLADEAFHGREVILLGRKVARAFSRVSPELAALAEGPPFSMVMATVPAPSGWAHAAVWLAPHPSGRNRWWNDPVNRRAGGLFFRLVAGRLELSGLDRPPRPAPILGPVDLLLDSALPAGYTLP